MTVELLTCMWRLQRAGCSFEDLANGRGPSCGPGGAKRNVTERRLGNKLLGLLRNTLCHRWCYKGQLATTSQQARVPHQSSGESCLGWALLHTLGSFLTSGLEVAKWEGTVGSAAEAGGWDWIHVLLKTSSCELGQFVREDPSTVCFLQL